MARHITGLYAAMAQVGVQAYKPPVRRKAIETDWQLVNPTVVQSIRQSVFNFAASLNATSQAGINRAYATFRQAMESGISRGDAIAQMVEQTRLLFLDPARAKRVVLTEASNAFHVGMLGQAKASGEAQKKKWLVSSDACERCKNYAARGAILLDEPFAVEGVGPYARIMHPPGHPHCMCSLTFVYW